MDTRVKYLGLDLESPIIVGSCGLAADVDSLCKMQEAGAGAVVLKSIFEEQIIYDIKRNTHIYAPVSNYGESYTYVSQHSDPDTLQRHFDLIRQAKQRLSIPVIGSIDCYSYENWVTYARQFQDAGCDALELNIAIIPVDTSLSSDDVDRTFSSIVQTLRKIITIPVSVKIGTYFTDLAKYLQQLSWTGLQGITLFNKTALFDIDTETETFRGVSPLTAPNEFSNTLRWTAVLSKKVRCGISATGGVETADDVVKLILAGATTVQAASCLMRNGIGHLQVLNDGLRQWMLHKGYDNLAQFRGRLAMTGSEKPAMLLRTQFMHDFADIK